MSRFPRMYAESTLARMYKKLNLSEETVKMLHDYFNAVNNLYMIIPLKKVFEIINSQNDNSISEEDFILFSEIARH